jgi:photosystem II stability/assembly factor-like uncharacterized protein
MRQNNPREMIFGHRTFILWPYSHNPLEAYALTRSVLTYLIILIAAATVVPAQAGWYQQKLAMQGDLVAVHFTSSKKGWVAGDNGYLASTNDGGSTWTRYDLGANDNINEIYFRNEDNGYLIAGRKMFITHDGGRSWQETRIFRTGEFGQGTPEFLAIRFSDKKRGYVVGSVLRKSGSEDIVVDSLLMRTEDGGETWRRIPLPTKLELFHLDFSGNSHGWIVGDNGMILATTDEGRTWRIQPSGVTRALFDVRFRNDKNGYAVGGGGTILRTENGGNTWQKVETPFTETFKRVDFSDDKTGWVVGYSGRILHTTDRGKTWVRQESGTTERLYGIFMDKKYGWAVGAKGVILNFRK